MMQPEEQVNMSLDDLIQANRKAATDAKKKNTEKKAAKAAKAAKTKPAKAAPAKAGAAASPAAGKKAAKKAQKKVVKGAMEVDKNVKIAKTVGTAKAKRDAQTNQVRSVIMIAYASISCVLLSFVYTCISHCV
jgi:hypothetical protein